MFWGLIMEPQRRYTQVVKKAFHISMAALDISASSDEPAQVMCGFEGRNYLLCTLQKGNMMQCPLDLNFNLGSELSFAANGKCHVHLTGYLIEEYPELSDEELEEEEEEEEQVKKKTKKKSNSVLNGPPKKKSKRKSEDDDDEDENSDESDTDIRNLLDKSLDEDEEDESFRVGSLDSDDEGDEEEESEDESEDEELGEDSSSLSEAESDTENLSPKKEAKINGDTPSKKQQLEPVTPKSKKKKSKNADEETKVIKVVKTPKGGKEAKGSPEKGVQSSKKQLAGGVVIEDLIEGKGQTAKSGRFVTVYYEGRLKQTNKMFDSTTKGNGFSFRLGTGEVIKGWDIGVAGMKLGGKRRITCPPAMAYGQRGSPPAIPSNSTLVFEVDLRKIK